MKPSEVTIKVYLVIDSEQVPISFTVGYEAKGYRELLREITAICVSLKETGFKLQPVDFQTPAGQSTGRITPEPSSAAFTWPAPSCPVCDVNMMVSRFQTDERSINYFCPNKIKNRVYCGHGAQVDNKTGSIDFWEKKK